MTRARSQAFRLDITVELDTSLVLSGDLDRVQSLLGVYVPGWSTGLHIWRYRQEKTPVDVTHPGALGQAVGAQATERGPLYYELKRRLPAAEPERIHGWAELRGSDDSLILVASIDEHIFWPVGQAWIWANHLTFQVCRSRVDGLDSSIWSKTMLEALCADLSPPHAYAHMSGEFEAKNISHERGGTQAVGGDVSKALRGLYWLNFFGRPYRDLIGRERLLSAPAHEVREIDDGVLLSLHENPRAWDTPEYREGERHVLGHLGPQYFFSKDDPNRQTVAPDFGLPALVGPAPVLQYWPTLGKVRWVEPGEPEGPPS